jgi:hypothetical protein
MAGKIGSASFSVLLVDGYDLLASKVKGFRHKVQALNERSEGLGDGTQAKTPTGLVRVDVSQSGAFFDDTAAGAHTLLSTPAGQIVSRVLAFAFAGNAIGKPFVGVAGVYGMAYEVLGHVGALTKANVSYDASGTLDDGVILQHATPKTVDWNTKTDGFSVDYTLDSSQRAIPITANTLANPSVVTTPVPHGLTTGQKILIAGVITSNPTINGQQTVTVLTPTTFSVPVNVTTAGTGGSFVLANTVLGGAGVQQVSAFSGFTGFVGKIRSSPDDITYADLVTFANVTAAPAAERVVVAGTIDRYLSFNGDVTGAGSITPFVGFSRT